MPFTVLSVQDGKIDQFKTNNYILFFVFVWNFFVHCSLLVKMKKHFFNRPIIFRPIYICIHVPYFFQTVQIVDHSTCLCFTFPNLLPFSRLRTWWRRSGRVGLECRASSTPCSRRDRRTTRSDPSKPESTSLVKIFYKDYYCFNSADVTLLQLP